jgi:hypothetical protein
MKILKMNAMTQFKTKKIRREVLNFGVQILPKH